MRVVRLLPMGSGHVAPANRAVMMPTRCIAYLAFSTLACACSFEHKTYSEHTETKETVYAQPQELCESPALTLDVPTVGYFVGVSTSPEELRVVSTPAHGMGAVKFQEIFTTGAAHHAYIAARGRLNGIERLELEPTTTFTRMALSEDGSLVVLAEKTRITIRSIHNKERYWQFNTESEANRLAVSSTSNRVLVLENSGHLTVTQLKDSGATELLFQEDGIGEAFLAEGGANLIVHPEDAGLYAYDINAAEIRKADTGDCTEIRSFLTSSENRLLLNGCGKLWLFDISTLELISVTKHDRSVWESTEISANGEWIVTGRRSKFKLHPIRDDQRVRKIDAEWKGYDTDTSSSIFLYEDPEDRSDRIRSDVTAVSPNGERLAVAYGNGHVGIYPADGGPTRFLKIRSVSSDTRWGTFSDLRYTADGEMLVARTKGGNVHLVPTELPFLSRELTFLCFGFKDRECATSIDLSTDGRMLAYLLDSGRVVIRPLPDVRAMARRVDFQLLADFTDDQRSSAGHSARRELDRHYATAHLIAQETATKSGLGVPVTKQMIERGLRESIDRFDRKREFWPDESAFLVIYVAAHGGIGNDGKKYILPADAKPGRHDTWISYEDFLEPVNTYIRNAVQNQNDRPSPTALVVLDTCQNPIEGQVDHIVPTPSSPAGVYVVESTSPGQYAFHWTHTRADFEFERSKVEESGFSFSFPPDLTPDNNFEIPDSVKQSFQSRMSVFSLAANCSARRLQDENTSLSFNLTLSKWLRDLPRAVNYYQSLSPAGRQPGKRQDVTVLTPDARSEFSTPSNTTSYDLPIFSQWIGGTNVVYGPIETRSNISVQRPPE